MELPNHGSAQRSVPVGGAADLGCQRPQTAPQSYFQTLQRPQFEAKFWDIIGLQLDLPTRAIVLCCDEKSQRQVLEETQPGLPLGQGRVATRTHDYHGHGTVTLFAALNYLNGKILAERAPRHPHQGLLSR